MKCFFVIAIAIFAFCNQSISQANIYHPFPLEGGEWRADYFDSNCAGLCEQRRYYTSGDTMIGNFKYKRLYGDRVYEAGNSFLGLDFGFLREDTINKKIFFASESFPAEQLLFDFDLDSGDVIPTTFLHLEGDTMIVKSIDSILIGNEYHKRFNLSNLTNYPVSLIEGVGWSGGLILEPIYALIGWEVTYNLKCLKVDQVIEYLDTSYVYPACDLPLAFNELTEASLKSVVFPNPALLESTVYFNLNDRQLYEIRFFDITGGFVVEVPSGNNAMNLSSSLFWEGIFLFEISKNEQPIYFGKLIIQ